MMVFNTSAASYFEGLLWTPAAAQKRQISTIRRLKVVKSCYQNPCFTKMEKEFFRYHDGIIPTYCILKDCRGRLQLLYKTAKSAESDG